MVYTRKKESLEMVQSKQSAKQKVLGDERKGDHARGVRGGFMYKSFLMVVGVRCESVGGR